MYDETEKDDSGYAFSETINNSPRAQDIWNRIEQLNKGQFVQWYKTVNNLAGSNDECIQTWSDGYMKVLEETLTDLNTEMTENYNSTLIHIEDLLKKLEMQCRDLHLKIPSKLGENELSLFEEKVNLVKKVQEYEQLISSRQKELTELEHKQMQLCESLGKQLKFQIQYSPFPTPIEIAEYCKCITLLEQEEFEVRKKFYLLKEQCIKLSSELKYEAKNEFESNILLSSDFISLTSNTMERLDSLYQKLLKERQALLDECCLLKSKIEGFWKILDIQSIIRDEFRNRYSENNLDTLAALKCELKKCEDIRNANMQIFVEKFRSKLEELWRDCHCSENEKKQFSHFKSACYTEDLLNLYEIEIQRWQAYYEENKTLLNTLEKYRELWSKVLELEDNSAPSNNRYKNRGGTLLQEERERNKLSKTIPLLESKIKILSEKFLERTGLSFSSVGKSTEEIFAEMYNLRENNRKARLNVRGGATTPSAVLKIQSKRKLTPGTPATLAVGSKRSKIDSAKRPVTPKSAKASKLTYTPLTLPVQRRRSRSSTDCKRKDKCKKSKKNRRSKSVDSSVHAYNKFQELISKRDGCHSSMLPTLIPLITVEEEKTSDVAALKPSTDKPGTSKSNIPLSHSNTNSNPSSKAKLTACKSNLNLLF